MSEFQSSIYDNIEIVMHTKGMSRRGLADAAGLKFCTVNSAFYNRAGMSVETLVKIAAALDCSPMDLINGDLEQYCKQSTFGRKLAMLRKSVGMTQLDVANEVHVSKQAVAKWELGQCEPDIATLVKLCDMLNVSADQLLCRT